MGHNFSLRLTYKVKRVNVVCSQDKVILSPPSLRRLVEKEVTEGSPDGIYMLRTWKASLRLLLLAEAILARRFRSIALRVQVGVGKITGGVADPEIFCSY